MRNEGWQVNNFTLEQGLFFQFEEESKNGKKF